MRAVVYDRYGPPEVLRFVDVPEPVPRDDEVRVRVHATAVTRLDCATREANRRSGPATSLLSRLVSGLRRPRQPILGSEFAGEVDTVGANVTEFALGDRAFGSTGFGFGGYAEFLVAPGSARVVPMPDGMSFTDAAALTDGGLNALWCLRHAEGRERGRVLVYGASGAIGTAGVQLAKSFGAEVTAVCGTRNVELVRSLGADTVIDYTHEDVTRNGERYDVILDAVGKGSFGRFRSSLARGGVYLATDGFRNLVLAPATRLAGGRRVVFSIPPRYTKQDVVFLKELVEAGRLRPVVDRVYPFDQVIEAARYVETEHKVGNVILAIAPELVRSLGA
jgi:NADPH:quinone reductase-like Zn-dependent oxidoreductase